MSAPRSQPTPRTARVRSLAEIRGRYGLAEERFEVLEEGPRDRQTRTTVGRARREPAKRFVATEQTLTGTAKLAVPAEVHARVEPPVAIPMTPMRWWPFVAAAVLVLTVVVFATWGEEPTPAVAPTTPGETAHEVKAPTTEPATLAVESPSEAPAASPPVAPTQRTPAPSTSGGRRHNGFPEFPELEVR